MIFSRLREIERLAMSLPIEDRRLLLVRLNRSVTDRLPPSITSPLDLFGAWQGRFPESFDIDAELRSIRNDWRRDNAA